MTHSRKNELLDIARRAMVERNLRPEFSPDAAAEARALKEDAVVAGDGGEIRDLCDLLWCSIDNESSRDLDQLSVAEPLPGATKVLVAIADVDAAVKRGSAIDDHARGNTTSVYTAAAVFSMIPERLSTDLTSLNQDEDRLAIVIEMAVRDDGAVVDPNVYRARVRNKAKLVYDDVAAWLDGEAPAPPKLAGVAGLEEQIRMQDRAARAMRARRAKNGALGLQSREAQVVFKGGELADLKQVEGNRTKEMIEDFMIAANGAVASFLARKGFASLRRVLRAPSRWDRIVALAAAHDHALPEAPSAEALSKFLAKERTRDPARFPELSLSIVKLLGRGEYMLETPGQKSEGHFGLAVSSYTHSTAPNRRFPDLSTQRLVKAALAGKKSPYANDELEALAKHCNEQEANAAKVERQVRKSAAALLLASRIGDEFEGVITGAAAKGTWVRIFHPAAEGRVVRGYKDLDVGDHVRVKLLSTDVENGFVDFAAQ
jgi:VacB/RNase II family 3'-5' exoribonuclease